jgi:DNA-binding NarL/FixJ family response regulator
MMTIAKRKILCIEDDEETAALIAEDLAERGFDIAIAHDGDEGLAAILRAMPDLILCDINLRGTSGFDLLENLTRIAPQFGSLPFVFLTGLTDRNDELRGRRLGAGDYVTKPIDFDILGAIVTARLAIVARTTIWARDVQLNDREIEALTWVARGRTSIEIARLLRLSKRTVDFHVDNACDKLDVTTRTEAAVKAVANRLINP